VSHHKMRGRGKGGKGGPRARGRHQHRKGSDAKVGGGSSREMKVSEGATSRKRKTYEKRPHSLALRWQGWGRQRVLSQRSFEMARVGLARKDMAARR
jgi:hypothetical protein